MDNLPEPRDLLEPSTYSVRESFGPASGWVLPNERGYRDFVSEGLRDDIGSYSSFDSMEEVMNFMRGVGEYSDVNSYFFGIQDMKMQSEEGFFGEMHCEKCEEDFREELVNADDPTELDLDPDSDVRVYFDQGETDSYRPGYDKFFRKLGFQCGNHPNVSLELKETWHEEQ